MYCHEIVILDVQARLESLYPHLIGKQKCVIWRYGRKNNTVKLAEYNAAKKYYRQLGLWFNEKEE